MSMTREELRQWFAEWPDDYYYGLYSEDDLTPEVAKSVLAALSPISREQVEKVWKGEWKIVEYEFFTCTRCGDSYYNGAESTEQAESYLNSGHVYDFCPHCGSANTEKAVQMVMERLEALHEDNSCS